eukprot:1154802-Pelagomonas_calceolata.AAC.2
MTGGHPVPSALQRSPLVTVLLSTKMAAPGASAWQATQCCVHLKVGKAHAHMPSAVPEPAREQRRGNKGMCAAQDPISIAMPFRTLFPVGASDTSEAAFNHDGMTAAEAVAAVHVSSATYSTQLNLCMQAYVAAVH